jgi:hypothetical protein
MGKRFLTFVLFVAFVSLQTLHASGGFKSAQPQQTVTVQAKKTPIKQATSEVVEGQRPADEIAREKEVEDINAKKASLNNTEWDVEMTLEGKEQGSPDVIVFIDNKVGVQSSMAKGFEPSNYTLTVGGDGSLIFETMQRTEQGKMSFIRGEISSDVKVMKGMVSFPEGETALNYYFKSLSKRVAAGQ